MYFSIAYHSSVPLASYASTEGSPTQEITQHYFDSLGRTLINLYHSFRHLSLSFIFIGTVTIKVASTGVTSKKNSPEYNALRERLTSFATQEMDCFPLTTQQELQQFCYYLRENLDLELSEKKPGSLILTVHCRTLEILERLWEDYCSGHLNEVVKECFLTDETTKTKEERDGKSDGDVETISLQTTISREDYLRCKAFLTEMSGKLSS